LTGDHFVGKLSAMGLPSRPTQPSIPPGSVNGPCAWNRLPPPLLRVHAAAVFKRQLKTFLFDRAFNWHYTVRRPCCALALTSP